MIINFSSYIKESVENITISRSIYDISYELPTYYQILEYLKKEIVGKVVNVTCCRLTPLRIWYDEADIDVNDVMLDERKYEFHFFGRMDEGHEEDFIIPEKSTITWTKTINRNINELDPYGEED